MTSTFLWTLIAIQIAMGAFDTFYHHEMTERLAWRPSQRHELQLHGVRNMLYASSPTLAGLGYVVMDEVHYLADRSRGGAPRGVGRAGGIGRRASRAAPL